MSGANTVVAPTPAIFSRVTSRINGSLTLPAGEANSGAGTAAPRILVVEDTPDLLLLLGKLVSRMGYQVELAANVTRALEIIRTQQIDLLLTDWAMPEANGGELIAALKRDGRDIPTVVLTGHDTDAGRRDAEAAGADRFLVKPLMRDELRRTISELLPATVPA